MVSEIEDHEAVTSKHQSKQLKYEDFSLTCTLLATMWGKGHLYVILVDL